MKNLILISDGESYEFDTLDELKKFMVPDLYTITEEEQKKFFYEKVFGYSMINDLQIVDTSKGVYEGDYKIDENEKINLEKAIIINNIDTYILSLCKFNSITLLEEKDNLIYTQNIDINIDDKDNYVIVNSFANEILYALVGDVE